MKQFSLVLLLLCTQLTYAQPSTQNKTGGVCFRVDDHQSASRWRDWNNLFNKYGFKFSLAINASRLFNDTAAQNALKEIAAAGHELMDHTPDHHMGYFSVRTLADTLAYSNHAAVDHINGTRICLKVDAPNVDFYTLEGPVNLIGNRLISVNNGEFAGINGNPFYALVYLPTRNQYAIYTSVQNRNASNPDTLVLQTYWQETWKNDTAYNIPYHRIRTEDVRSHAPSNLLLAQRSKQLFLEMGLPEPKTWIQPGGSFALLNRMEVKAFANQVGYITGAVNLQSAQKCYNEHDPNQDRRFSLQGPDFMEETQSYQTLINTISDRSARHYNSFGLSHIFNVSGGWTAFLNKVDSLLGWCSTNQIPIRTYRQWGSILYDSIPNQAANVLPLLNKDLNNNGLPDGYSTSLGFSTSDGVPLAANCSFGSANNNTAIAVINNLGGLEKGTNLVSLYTKGMPGDSIRMLISYPEFTLPSQMIMFGAGTPDYTLQTKSITIPENVTRMNVSFIVIKRNNPGMVRLSFMEMRKSSVPALNKGYLQEKLETDSFFTPLPINNHLYDGYYNLNSLSVAYAYTGINQVQYNASTRELQLIPTVYPFIGRDSVRVWASNPDGFSDTAWFKFAALALPAPPDTTTQTDTTQNNGGGQTNNPPAAVPGLSSKTGGLCFRIDDYQTAANYRALNQVFNNHQKKFTVGVNASRFYTDSAMVNALKELAAAGHEIADHTADHAMHFFNVNRNQDTLLYVGHPGVDRFIGKKVCLRIDSVRTENFVGEGLVNANGNILISQSNGEWRTLNAPVFYSNIFIPALNRVFTYSNLQNRNANDPDTLTLGGYWGETVSLPSMSNLSHHRVTQYDIKANQAGLTLLLQVSKTLFDSFGLPQPKTILCPSGNYAMLNRTELKALAEPMGYDAGGVFTTNPFKCFNEVDTLQDKRWGMHGPDFREENTSARSIMNTLADNSARHHASFGLSTLMNLSGGMAGYLGRIDSLLAWSTLHALPVLTFNQWAAALYDSVPDPTTNIIPSLAKDINYNNLPDGFSSVLASIDSTDGTAIDNNKSLVRTTNGAFATLNNLGGLEKGNNIVEISTKGMSGDSVRMVYSFPELGTTTYTLTFPANTTNFTNYTAQINIPAQASRINITWNAAKRTVAGPIKISSLKLYKPASQQKKANEKNTALVQTQTAVSLYPNPFRDIIHVQSEETPQKISLVKLNGQVIVEAENTLELQAPNALETGLYLLFTEFANQSRQCHKIIKN